MKRHVPTALELEGAATALLTSFSPELIDLWKQSPVTAAMFTIIERIRMDCLEQAEALPEGNLPTILLAQAQIMARLAEELDETITETIEDEDTEAEDDTDASRPSPRRRANYTP